MKTFEIRRMPGRRAIGKRNFATRKVGTQPATSAKNALAQVQPLLDLNPTVTEHRLVWLGEQAWWNAGVDEAEITWREDDGRDARGREWRLLVTYQDGHVSALRAVEK